LATIFIKVFEPILDVWQYTFISIFLSIALIIWEFTRSKQANENSSTKNQKHISSAKINKNISEELKNSVMETETMENTLNPDNNPIGIVSEIVEEEIKAENPFLEIITINEQNAKSSTKQLRDTEQMVLLDEYPTGFFVEGDLPDELLIEDIWCEGAIEITEEEPPSTEHITEILSKIEDNIPLDEEEIRIYEYYFNIQDDIEKALVNNNEHNETKKVKENIFAEY
jgi:hypothetical protein